MEAVSLNPVTTVLMGRWLQRHTNRETPQRQRWEGGGLKPSDIWAPEAGRGKKDPLPEPPGEPGCAGPVWPAGPGLGLQGPGDFQSLSRWLGSVSVVSTARPAPLPVGLVTDQQLWGPLHPGKGVDTLRPEQAGAQREGVTNGHPAEHVL